MKIEKCAKTINFCSIRFRARQPKRIAVLSSARKIVPALNYMFDGKAGYERALVNSQIALSERSRVPAFQNSAVGYVKNRIHKTWR